MSRPQRGKPSRRPAPATDGAPSFGDAPYRALFENARVGICRTAPDGRFLAVNPALARMLGYETTEELLAVSAADLYPETGERAALIAASSGRDHVALDTSWRRRDGSLVPIRLSGWAVRDAGDRVIAFEALVEDVTERREIESYLRMLAQAVKSTAENITITDLQGRLTFVSDAFLSRYGYTEAEVLGQPVVSLIDSPRNPPGLQETIRRTTSEQGTWRGELWNRTRAGREVLIDLRTSQVRDASGAVTGLMGVWTDITAQREEAEQRAATERRLAELVETSPVGIYRSTPDGRLLMANPALARMLGYDSVDELLQVNMRALYIDPTVREENVRRYGEPGSPLTNFDLVWKRRDGRLIHVQLDAMTLADPEVGVVFDAFVRDVTERRQLEAQLRQAQKMEAVGQLAGGVAHDFNNLLTAILGYASLLKERELPADALEEIGEIEAAAGRAASLTQQLLAFSRRQVMQPVALDVGVVVRGVESMLRRLIGEHITLTTRAGADLPPVKADRGQLEQVIINLAVNARDAMADGGALTIEAHPLDVESAATVVDGTLEPGRYVCLAVSDTGVGMDEQTRGRAFEPFFTTKDPGTGTGLGLATVYGIVQQSGGHVAVASTPGQGSTFRVYLPAVTAAPAESGDRSGGAPRGGTETILLVEDEPSVRELTRRGLERFGYRVLEASDGRVALAAARAHEGPIHLVFTDVVMPGMSGRELVVQLLAARPNVRALYASGYADSAVMRHGVLEPGIAYLGKPYGLDAMARKVREVLDAPDEPPATG